MTTNNSADITNVTSGTSSGSLGVWVPLGTQSGSQSIYEFTGFTSAYRALFFDIQDLRAASDKVGIYCQLGSVGGGYVTSGYIYVDYTAGVSNSFAKEGATSDTIINLTNHHAGVRSANSVNWINGQMILRGFASTTAPSSVKVETFYTGEWTSDDYIRVDTQVRIANPGSGNTITKAKFYSSDASNINGSIQLYGILA